VNTVILSPDLSGRRIPVVSLNGQIVNVPCELRRAFVVPIRSGLLRMTLPGLGAASAESRLLSSDLSYEIRFVAQPTC
jgi:hypothetical protein